MRLLLQLIAVSVFSAVYGANAQAYGPTGHRIVGTIAESYLCADAVAGVEDMLQGESLADAGLWADRIRSDPAWRHAAPWHYVNIPDDAPVELGGGGDRGDVLQAITRFGAELADESVPPRYRADALRFLVHFVADVHQPLHVGRAADRGGNSITVVLGGKRTNLHALWDAQALLKADRRTNEYRVADQADAVRALTRDYAARLGRAQLLEWARESKEYRSYVYSYARPEGGAPVSPDAAYLATAREITMLRLSQAGVRLASTLNGVFCRAAGTP